MCQVWGHESKDKSEQKAASPSVLRRSELSRWRKRAAVQHLNLEKGKRNRVFHAVVRQNNKELVGRVDEFIQKENKDERGLFYETVCVFESNERPPFLVLVNNCLKRGENCCLLFKMIALSTVSDKTIYKQSRNTKKSLALTLTRLTAALMLTDLKL